MAKPINKITKDVRVGIYDTCKDVARIYTDKIIVITPYVKWVGNTGGYAERKAAIRDQGVIAAVRADLADACEESAWAKILDYLQAA